MRNTFYRDDDHLAHHGVKGMKWGVRKAKNAAKEKFYRASAGIYDMQAKAFSKLGNKTMAGMSRSTAKYARKKADEARREGQTSETLKRKGRGAVAKVYKAAMNQASQKVIRDAQPYMQRRARAEELTNAKDLGDFVSMTVGNKRNARVARVNADMYDALERHANTKHSRNRYKAAAENSRTFEKYYDRVRQKKGKDKAIEMITGKEAYSLPWKRANGKTISYGRHVAEEIVNNLIWSGAKTYAQKAISDEMKRRRASNSSQGRNS